jgi:hypothetical protein
VRWPGGALPGVGVVAEPGLEWPGGALPDVAVVGDPCADSVVAASAVNARAASSGSRRCASAKHQLGDRA